jgi:hypothetical protein
MIKNRPPIRSCLMKAQCNTIPMFEGKTMTSAGTVFGQCDTMPGGDKYNSAIIELVAGTVNQAETAITTLKLVESDTAMTALTDGTAITQFQGAAATSTSAGFVLPPLSSTKQTVLQFNVNLTGRKRYLGIYFAPTGQTLGVSAQCHLFKPANSEQIATVATTSDGLRLIVNG